MSAVIDDKTAKGLKETLALALLAFSLYFLLALASFDMEDAVWTHSGNVQAVVNAGGPVGAWLADVCFSLFGLGAYLLAAWMLWRVYQVFRPRNGALPKSAMVFSGLGFFATMTALAALLYLHWPRLGPVLPNNSGGILGQECGDALVLLFGEGGASLLLITLLLAGITLLTGLSWLHLLSQIGAGVLWLFAQAMPASKEAVDTYSAPVRKVRQPRPKKARAIESVPESEPVAAVTISPPAQVVKVKRGHSIKAFPDLNLLDDYQQKVKGYSHEALTEMSHRVEEILAEFNVQVEVVAVNPGPVITRFELQPAPGVKVSRISGLAKDLARALSVRAVRIVEIIPDKPFIGLEIPNQEREMVALKTLLASKAFANAKGVLTLALGKDIAGAPVVADLAKMPHALVAGTTGSGKSVAINTMILSLLYRATPDQVRLIMIDPKMLELSVYEGIPHLLTPVVTDMKQAHNALRWAVGEMERRYKLMSKLGVRNLAGFNDMVTAAQQQGAPIMDPLADSAQRVEGEPEPVLEAMPAIVIVIDELADMMMIVGKKVEESIARLAQKARAAGIHLILATQRPSVDVLTGLIKANVPTRISFQVSSRIDSRTVLDQGGAESLLGNGDMLFLPSGTSIPIRAHGAFVDDHEVHKVVEFLKQTGPANYLDDITREPLDGADGGSGGYASFDGDNEQDALYDQAVAFVTESRKASISSVQRRFKIGYNRAARMIEDMEAAGVVTPAESNGSRDVLAPPPVNAD
ncbi:MAG: DNA translocase FtsK 4TM domain-containing protein [Methylococcales bacterium]|nr:DNA translocase FtsK 4TM domain-containing protein [Methylococcales bacterium]